ncbi:hypothetical protein ITJ58_18780 [Curtobacterium flaccumfaciens]|uniref:hypothetical protein n=1 Tax=Curtobacterium flaccumfaciens TaxID=2035 RepID=UPI00188B9174|nr:hypothetical protein [Curtobacterium flaccumfaciens]MBF4595805.1 hypothetical protein [Curtobacterium flaccumfaciens]
MFLFTPPLAIDLDLTKITPVAGSVVQWFSLVASIVAIVLTIRAARRSHVRELREQVEAVFVRRSVYDNGETLAFVVVNQSPQSVWDAVVIERRGEEEKTIKLDPLGEMSAGNRRPHNTYRTHINSPIKVTLVLKDYRGRTWAQRIDKASAWKKSKLDTGSLHAKARDSSFG